jgi:hypothetical protein
MWNDHGKSTSTNSRHLKKAHTVKAQSAPSPPTVPAEVEVKEGGEIVRQCKDT